MFTLMSGYFAWKRLMSSVSTSLLPPGWTLQYFTVDAGFVVALAVVVPPDVAPAALVDVDAGESSSSPPQPTSPIAAAPAVTPSRWRLDIFRVMKIRSSPEW